MKKKEKIVFLRSCPPPPVAFLLLPSFSCLSSLLAFEKVKVLFWRHLSVLLAYWKSFIFGPQNLNIPVLTLNLWNWCLSATPPALLPHPPFTFQTSNIWVLPFHNSNPWGYCWCIVHITRVVIRPSANIIILFLSFRYHFNLVFSIRNVRHPQIVFTRDKQMDSSRRLS